MTSKQQIDDYISANYSKLVTSIKKIARNYRKLNFEPAEIISLMYQDLIKKANKYNPEQIESYCIRFITKQFEWTNSEYNKLGIEGKRIKLVEVMYDSEDSLDDYVYKIYKEKEYNEQKNVLYDFKRTLQLHEKIFYEAMYTEEGKAATISQLKEKFKKNRNYLTKFRKELKEKEQEFIKQNYKK
jgi:hypothetical protein